MTAMPCCFTTNPNAHAARPRPRSNGLGVAGFVTSLVGLLTCGVLSPFGLMLSVPALVRGPRGFAMAGTVLGLIGTLWIAGIAAVTAVGAKAAVEGVERVQLVMTATQEQSHLAEKIDAFIAQNGRPPSSLTALPGVDELALADPWGAPYRYEPGLEGAEFTLRSDGPDGIGGTSDDVIWSRHQPGEGPLQDLKELEKELRTLPLFKGMPGSVETEVETYEDRAREELNRHGVGGPV